MWVFKMHVGQLDQRISSIDMRYGYVCGPALFGTIPILIPCEIQPIH